MELGKQITSEALEVYNMLSSVINNLEEDVLFTGNMNMDSILGLRWTLTEVSQQFEFDIWSWEEI